MFPSEKRGRNFTNMQESSLMRTPYDFQPGCARRARLCAWLAMASVVATANLAYAGEKFTVSSADFSDGGKIGPRQVFNDAGCNGPNESPSLTWRNAPAA
ncbi:hypothetical protein ACLFKT_34800 [Paraburkholderia sp. BR14261]